MSSGSRYELLPSFLIGFHGTDLKTAEKILSGKSHLAASENDYDWLGHGMIGYDALLTARGGQEFLPKNGDGKELWKRKLDCAVIRKEGRFIRRQGSRKRVTSRSACGILAMSSATSGLFQTTSTLHQQPSSC